MPDREKVIKELTEIYDEAYDRWVHRPYIEDKLITLIRDGIPDALALLREQDQAPAPRLLTLEEVRALPVGTIVFEQFYNGEEQSFGSPLPAMKASRDTLVSLDGETALDPSWAEPDGTGSYFRWWSAKPED